MSWNLKSASSNPGVTSSNPRVTSSNLRVTSSNPWFTSSNMRVRVPVYELRVQIH